MEEDDQKLLRNLPLSRALRGLSQTAAADVAGVPRSSLCEWENGRKTPEPPNLARLRAGLGVSEAEVTFLDGLRDLAERGELAAPPRLELHALRVGLAATALAGSALEQIASCLESATLSAPSHPSAADREEAPQLLARFLDLDPEERQTLLEISLCFRKWALCEALCVESRKRAGEDPGEARELARWAVAVAEMLSDTDWSLRLRGLATAALAHAERAAGEADRAGATLQEARDLWESGRDDWGLLADGEELLRPYKKM